MKFYRGNQGPVQNLVALSVCVGMLASLCLPLAASPARRVFEQARIKAEKISSTSATPTSDGVVLQWRSNLDPDNLGFNIYRAYGATRVRVNSEIVPGAIFISNTQTSPSDLHSYSWLDRAGPSGATYYIEWVSISGAAQFVTQAITIQQKGSFAPDETTGIQGSAENNANGLSQKSFPTAEQLMSPTPGGVLENQWAIAAKSGLKISIKRDGWYRVTQAEMTAAGFNPAVDIRNLRLFNDGQELAINTSQSSGPFGSSDYIEFYGRGLDSPTTDIRTYYLIADTVTGKRVGGALRLDSAAAESSSPSLSSSPVILKRPSWFGFVWALLDPPRALSTPEPTRRVFEAKPVSSEPKLRQREVSAELSSPPDDATDSAVSVGEKKPVAHATEPSNESSLATKKEEQLPAKNAQPFNPISVKSVAAKKVAAKKPKRRKQHTRRYNHAAIVSAVAPLNFDSTFEFKERLLYYVAPLNGDAENWFGRILNTVAVNQTLNTPNPELTATAPAKLEIALQGVSAATHQVNILLNNTLVGSFSYANQEHAAQTFDVPVSLLQNGANTLTFSPVPGGFVSLIDYARITYPHAFRADSDSLKFNLRGTQSLNVDGFSSPNVRLIDYTDPFSVTLTRPAAQASAAGYSVTIPTGTPRKKDQRLLYAIINGQFQQAAALSLNQPSTINSGNLSQTVTSGADFLMITHKSLLPGLGPLVTARQNQGFTVGVVDVEDVYDEFSYGVHGPGAIKDFLAYASTHWPTPPRYIIFAGDASFDPRDYYNVGNFDFVPTKLVDATFNETASDDWLADFDDDGVADIPVGRLPLRSLADANLVISKIVNFTPVTPEAALLVADDPGTPAVWDFETASDDVQALLPATMTVQRVNVRTEPSAAAATSDIIDGFMQGRAVVNYSGHGNVDVWSGASIFTSANATALTNGNKLPFVIVMDCLNGYFHDPTFLSLAEAFLKAPNGGAIAAFASSGLTTTPGQRQMELELYKQLYGPQSMAVGDAIKVAKNATFDIDVKRTWIYFGDPSLKIR